LSDSSFLSLKIPVFKNSERPITKSRKSAIKFRNMRCRLPHSVQCIYSRNYHKTAQTAQNFTVCGLVHKVSTKTATTATKLRLNSKLDSFVRFLCGFLHNSTYGELVCLLPWCIQLAEQQRSILSSDAHRALQLTTGPLRRYESVGPMRPFPLRR
jgi:hypothetical protein